MKAEDLFKWNFDPPPSPGRHVSEHTALGLCNKAGPNKLECGLPPSSVPEGLGPAPCTRPGARVNGALAAHSQEDSAQGELQEVWAWGMRRARLAGPGEPALAPRVM